MVAFIDDHRAAYGVEPICEVLPIAPSTYFQHKAQAAEPTRRSARARRDGRRSDLFTQVHRRHRSVYGGRKVWRQLQLDDVAVVRCRARGAEVGAGSENGCYVPVAPN